MAVILAIVLLVAIFAGVCAFLLFPSLGEGVSARFSGLRKRSRERKPRPAQGTSPDEDQPLFAGFGGDFGGWLSALYRQRWLLVGALIVVLVPSIVIFATRQTVVLDNFEEEDMSDSSTMIAQLLRGERLTPPPAPPPEVFTNAEVRKVRPEIVTADRKWARIDPGLQQRVLAIFEVMHRQYGYEMVLVEGYRSPERQAKLMGGGKATNAGAWQSCHQYGLAVDAAPMRNGRLQWDMGDPWVKRGYFLYGELAQQAGLEWGGGWRSIKDYVHVELAAQCRRARAAKRAELKRG